MRQALASYLSDVEHGLRALSASRRRLFLRELEGHLLDEAEARGVSDEVGMEALLKEKERPEDLARELGLEDGDANGHRHETALLSGALIGAATGGYLWLQTGWPWHLSLSFAVAHGLAVGAGMFLVRPRWQRLSPVARLAASTLFGTLLAAPLGFTSFRGFVLSRMFYGGFTGFLLERHAEKRPLWHLALEVLGFTAFDGIMEVFVLQRMRRYHLWEELSFNIILALAVLAAMRLRSALAARWVFRSEHP